VWRYALQGLRESLLGPASQVVARSQTNSLYDCEQALKIDQEFGLTGVED
jgi:hypothetical protein